MLGAGLLGEEGRRKRMKRGLSSGFFWFWFSGIGRKEEEKGAGMKIGNEDDEEERD